MDSDEFSTSPVPAERSIPRGKIAVTNVLFSICLPTLITGLDLAIAAPRRYFLSGIIVGSLVLTFIGILTSVLGSRTRLSSYMLARIAFGTHGSTLLNLAFALSLRGWFGVNINLFGDAMVRLMTVLPGLKVTAGVRYEEASEGLSFTTDGYYSGGTPPFAGSAKESMR